MPRQPSTSIGEKSGSSTSGACGAAPRAAPGEPTASGHSSKPSAIAKAMPRQPSTSIAEESGGGSSGVSSKAPKGGARRAHGEQRQQQQAPGHRKGDAEAALDEQRREERRQQQRHERRCLAVPARLALGACRAAHALGAPRVGGLRGRRGGARPRAAHAASRLVRWWLEESAGTL